MEIDGARILVTGGTGMIGQAVVRHLQEAGAEVATLSRRGARPGNPDHTAVQGNITDPASLDLSGFDAVVHGAAWVGFALNENKNELMRATNISGTKNVLDAAVEAGCKKVVHVSSVAALGTGWGKLVDESWFHQRPTTFQSVYEETKYKAHGILLAEDRIETAAVMPSVVLGVGNSSSGLITKLYLQRRFPLTPIHPGKMAFVHVEDVAAGTVAALRQGTGAYVLSETSMTLPELFAMMHEATGVRPPRLRVPFGVLRTASALTFGKLPNKDFVRNLRTDSLFDAGRAKAELGWAPDLRGHLRDDAAKFGKKEKGRSKTVVA